MLNLSRLKPAFWDYRDAASGPENTSFSFRRNWVLIVILTMTVSLAPLFVMIVADYRHTKRSWEKQVVLETTNEINRVLQAVSSALTQRLSVLQWIATDPNFTERVDSARISSMLDHLRGIWDDFIALAVAENNGRILTSAGPEAVDAERIGASIALAEFASSNTYVSEVIPVPTIGNCVAICVKDTANGTGRYFLMAILDAAVIQKPLGQRFNDDKQDTFLVSPKGILQTQSRFYGQASNQVPFSLPERSDALELLKTVDPVKGEIYTGIAEIKSSPFVLIVIRQASNTVNSWVKPRKRLIGFLLASILMIVLSVVGVATYLVNRIHAADRRRIQALHQVEYANKMTSIGRLASGVAHEINNPLAIINQKTGLVKDLLILKQGESGSEKMIGLVDDVLKSVNRCGAITRRMLDFARHMETSSFEWVDIEEVIRQVLAFMEKEAELQNIEISVKAEKGIQAFQSDRGNLQQIFLNLINNAFAAMDQGGKLSVHIKPKGLNHLCVTVSDTGHGIPAEDLNRVFEPFFSTRQGRAGTGLGLSVTYGLVSEMGGNISVYSKMNKGTTFAVTLPVEQDANAR